MKPESTPTPADPRSGTTLPLPSGRQVTGAGPANLRVPQPEENGDATLPPTQRQSSDPDPADLPTRDPADVQMTQTRTLPISGSPADQGISAPPGYEIVGTLGRGGMGVVYHARQTKLNRDVALKMILSGGHSSAEDRARFLAEAEAIASLNHPGIVQVFEFGNHAGQPFFALEYCPGGSLANQLEGTPLPARDAATLVQKLAYAVHAAHEKGIVHRDLKPANILLRKLASEDTESTEENQNAGSTFSLASVSTVAKITDFGLAKRLERGADITKSGAIIGTPSYMAPEQALGEGHRIGPATDVYALGAILYELLTGRPPFREETQLDTILRVIDDDPVGIRQLQTTTPIDLETICHTCLQKDPQRRYVSAKDLARDLGRWLAGESILARPAGRVEKAVKWVKRRPAVAALCVTIASLIALVIGGVIYDQRNQITQQRQRERAERRSRAFAMADSLETATIAAVPQIVRALDPLRDEADPILHQKYSAVKPGSRERLRYLLALAPGRADRAGELLRFVPDATADEILVLREALREEADQVTALWPLMAGAEPPARLRFAALLADYSPTDERWRSIVAGLTDHLVRLNPLELAGWASALAPIHVVLTPPLVELYVRTQVKLKAGELEFPELATAASQLELAVSLLFRYAADQPDTLSELLQLADERHFESFFSLANASRTRVAAILESVLERRPPEDAKDADKENLAKRQANAAVALLRMNQPVKVWPLLKRSPPDDPRLRSYLIHRLSSLGADPKAIVERLGAEMDPTIRRALILSLGEFGEKQFPPTGRSAVLPTIQNIYQTDVDPGLHAASEWLLRTWKQEAWLKEVNDRWTQDTEKRGNRLNGIKQALATGTEKAAPQWYVNSLNQTMIVIPGPSEFMMGSPRSEAARQAAEVLHKRRISRTIAVAAKPVTISEYKRFDAEYGGEVRKWTPTDDCPAIGITWFDAAEYCNWLSRQEGLPATEWCYEPRREPTAIPALAASSAGVCGTAFGPLLAACGAFPGRTDPEFKSGMSLASNYLRRTGYRLPTEAEMEYITRAGAVTARYFGESEDLLTKYAYYQKNSRNRPWPVGSLKPNDLGFFDVQGNVYVWCHDAFVDYPRGRGNETVEDTESQLLIDLNGRPIRGGAFSIHATQLRSAFRNYYPPTSRLLGIGFRLARTFPVGGLVSESVPQRK